MTTPQNPLRALSRVKTQVYPEVRSNLHTPPQSFCKHGTASLDVWGRVGGLVVACDGQELTESANT